MLAFTLRRILQALGVLVAVGVLSFAMFRFAGDPVSQIVSLDTPPEQRAEVRKSLGLDDPVLVQFARYFGNAAQFNFGISYQLRQPVASLLAQRMPATLMRRRPAGSRATTRQPNSPKLPIRPSEVELFSLFSGLAPS